MSLTEKLRACVHCSTPTPVKHTIDEAIELLTSIHKLVDGNELDDTTSIVSDLIQLLDAADMSVAAPPEQPPQTLKVRVYENSRVEFVVEVPDGLQGEALEAAIEEARVQAGPEVERTESVLSIDWDLE